MDTILTLVSVLGLGALIISVYIFAVAARRFVTEDDYGSEASRDEWVERSGRDRRQNTGPVLFPITVNGELITEDRRRGERRAANG
ncbi:MAG: hypothetical protein ACX93N_08065 [Pseudohaliea sp.]